MSPKINSEKCIIDSKNCNRIFKKEIFSIKNRIFYNLCFFLLTFTFFALIIKEKITFGVIYGSSFPLFMGNGQKS
jgi:hypothetical protein